MDPGAAPGLLMALSRRLRDLRDERIDGLDFRLLQGFRVYRRVTPIEFPPGDAVLSRPGRVRAEARLLGEQDLVAMRSTPCGERCGPKPSVASSARCYPTTAPPQS
jgi:hypothetical protein